MHDTSFRGFYKADIFDCEPFEMFTVGDDALSQYILGEKRFEPFSMRTMQRLLKEASCFIDVGANVGVYSMVAAKTNPNVPIFAFEPNPLAYARLTVHVKINSLQDRVHVFPLALAQANGVMHFAWVRKSYGWISSGGGLVGNPAGLQDRQATVVISQRLDDLPVFPAAGKPLMKIDVEGGEAAVFSGMQNFLNKFRPDIILESFVQENCDVITAMTKPLGYRYYWIDEEGKLEEREKLVPAKVEVHSFNQLLTTSPQPLS